jgi:hypothetical protein
MNLAYGFADDFDVADNRVLNLRVLLKGFEVWHRLKVIDGSVNRLRNVPHIIFDALRVLHRGWACCNTSLRNFGGSPFGVKTDTGTPSNSSASVFKPASVSRLVDCPGSTNKSRSLSSVSVPFATDPNTRGRDRP